MTFDQWIRDTGERATSTLVEALIVYVLAAATTGSEFWAGLVTVAAITLANVVKSALTFWIPHPTSWWLDVVVRFAWTFVISIAGAVASSTWLDLGDQSWWSRVIHAAAIAGLAIVKGILAKNKLHTLTPASFALAA
jgi:hypothetical protein